MLVELAVLVLVCQQKLSEWDPRIREPRHAEPVGSPCVLDVPFDPGEEKRAASKGPAAQMLEEPPELPQGRNLLGWGGALCRPRTNIEANWSGCAWN